MDYVQRFQTVRAWQLALGLLPIPLTASVDEKERYVLLNGTTGNFCLDFHGGVDRTLQRDTAWSCDVGHYVICVNDRITVNRWDSRAPEETYSTRSVLSQLHEFHRHLEKSTPDRSRSVVTHVLSVFRRIREVLDDRQEGLSSLRVLLHLFASAASGIRSFSEQDLEVWGLTPDILQFSDSIPPSTWMSLFDDICGIRRSDDLRPEFQLILRHSAGAVFQEAHIEAQVSPVDWLPSLERPATVRRSSIPAEAGIYFTPQSLARTLAEEATRAIKSGEDSRSLLLFDPACGSGELLKECLRLLSLKGFAGKVRVIGWDKSAAAVDMARFVLAVEKQSWVPNRVSIEIVKRDSLTASWPPSVDILIMNPPFKSWLRMDQDEQEIVTNVLGKTYRPNLALVFVRYAVECLKDDGILAMVIPNSLFEATSGVGVRSILADNLAPLLIARLGDQSIFSRALVDAGLYVGRRGSSNSDIPAILWADSRSGSLNHALRGLRKWRSGESIPINEEGFSIYHRHDLGKTSLPWMARAYEAWTTYENVQATGKTLPAKRVFTINQGVRMGNDIFIVKKNYFESLKKAERRFFRPAVMNLSISDGKLNDNYYVFYPYGESIPSIANDEDLEKYIPTYFHEILSPAKAQLKQRKSLASPSLRWWELQRPRGWQYARRPKIVSKYFGGTRSFAFDQIGDFVVVVGNAWLLAKGRVELPITEDEIYLAILPYLNSKTAEDLIKFLSVQVSGGQWDLSNKYLKNLPIPDLGELTPLDLNQMIQAGLRISNGEVERWTNNDELVASIVNV